MAPTLAKLDKENFDKFPEEIQDAVNTAPEKRTPFQWQMYYKVKPQVLHTEEEAAARLKGVDAERYAQLKAELRKFDNIKPRELPVAQAMIEKFGGDSLGEMKRNAESYRSSPRSRDR